MRDVGIVGPETEEAIQALTEKLAALKTPLAEVNTFAQEAGKNIQDALGDSILASLDGSTKSIGRIWGDMLKRMAAQTAAAQLGKLLAGRRLWHHGPIGGAAGDLFKWFGSFGGARADGPVRAGGYLVGERGPEIVVPRTTGTVLPNGTGLAGGSTYQVIVQGDASENTLRLIRGALAQYEARMLMQQRERLAVPAEAPPEDDLADRRVMSWARRCCAAKCGPGTVIELADRAHVGRHASRYTCSRLWSAGHLVEVDRRCGPGGQGRQSAVLALPSAPKPEPGASLAAALALATRARGRPPG